MCVSTALQCASCGQTWIAVQAVVVFIFVLVMIIYARLVAGHPEAMGKWVSTVSIAMNHAQTLQVIDSLLWPDSARVALSIISVEAST